MKKMFSFLLITVMLITFGSTFAWAQSIPVVTENDPQLTEQAVQLNKDVMSTHPRLLFSPKDLPKLKAFYNSDKAAVYREAFEKVLPVCKAQEKPGFLKDATDGQRQGLWRMPTVALHYAITGDPRSFEKGMAYLKLLESLPEWESAPEVNSGMSSANIMIGAALLFDNLYNDMPADFREKFRQKLWYMARVQYYGGHLMRNPGVHYWQGDPQNNHRWHRDAGMILALATAYNGQESQAWMIRKAYDELEFVNQWLPEDGTSHEGASYLVFGAAHLTLANHASDRCFGTKFLKTPFYQTINTFLLQSQVPGWTDVFQFGDSGGSGSYGQFSLKAACENNMADDLAGLMEMFKIQPNFFMWHWMTFAWLDPDMKIGSLDRLPKTSFFSDMGLAFMRDGWESKNVGVMFKCGPLGGYKLNEYRKEHAKNGVLGNINVAHDDPDANSFIIWKNGAFVAETDRYSRHKMSSHHNTILINGMGQMVPGRMEDQTWSQPGPVDMREMAVVTAWKDADEVVVCEGEASGSYLAVKQSAKNAARPGLDRYRRSFIWVKEGYLLVLDDIRAPEAVDIIWLMQAPQLTAQQGKELAFELKHDNASCGMQINQISNVHLTPVIGVSAADGKSKPLGWQQLQLKGNSKTLKLAALLTPWGGDLKIITKTSANGSVHITVTGGKINDTWQWTPADGKFEPSTIKGNRKGGFNVEVGAKDKVVIAESK